MTITSVLLLTAVFVLLNGLFVAAEFALIGAPKTAIEHKASSGNRVAARLAKLLGSPVSQDRYIAAAQLGITIASLGLGMYGEHQLAEIIEPGLPHFSFIQAATVATVLALLALTFLHIVFGEMVPKTLALHSPERAAQWAYWPMRLTVILFYPAVRISSGIATAILRVFGIRRQENAHEQTYTPEELQLIVEESREGGAIRSESGRLLQELFEFGDLTASQVMLPRVRVIGIPVGATAADVRAILLRPQRHTRYPVFDGDLDHIVGMLHIKDLLRRLVHDQPVTSADVRPMPVVPETAALDDVLATMQRSHAHMATVIDEHGGTAGVVSLEDLLEEVVGEIDEGAGRASAISPQADGSLLVEGTVRLDELGKCFDLELEHEEVDSVSGLVLAVLGRSPLVGDVVDYGRVHFQVTATSGRGVKEVRAWLAPLPTDDAE